MRNLKRVLSLAVASVMMIGMMVVGTGAAYADVDSADNREAIEVLQMVGLMEGDEKGNFNPDKNVTRNEMAVIMANLLDLKLGGTTPFTDVPAWAQDYVAACYNNGIVAGTSATTYGGEQGVTPAQAALMLLKACGYFQYQGEFEDDWQMAVVKRGGQVDMFDDVDAAVNAPMTRNDVAQMVLNALETTMVMVTQEGGIDVNIGGGSVSVRPTYKYEDANDLTGVDYNNSGDGTRQLCEDVYRNSLKKLSDGNDDFGRPSTRWTYKNDSVTAPKAPEVSYTAAVEGGDIYVDLGRVNPDTIVYVVDGDDTAAEPTGFDIASRNDVKVGGNGALTEVYTSEDNNGDITATVVVINTYAAKVSNCKEADGSYEITVKGETKKFESDYAFEDDAVVLYTKTVTRTGATDEIKTMQLADVTTGTLTRVKDADSFVVDGETYKYNATVAASDKLSVSTTLDKEIEIYLDSYGYAILLDEVDSSTDYAVVTATNQGGDWKDNYQAKLLFPDGNVQIVSIEDEDKNVDVGDIVTYTVDSDNVYDLDVKGSISASAVSTDLKGENGKAGVTVAGTDYTANSKTEFFFYNSTDDDYYAWTGIKNFPGFDNSGASYKYTVAAEGSVLRAVYVEADTDLTSNNSKAVTFLVVKSSDKQYKDSDLGNYYQLDAVVDGEVVDGGVMISANAYGKLTGNTLASSLKINDKDVITSVSAVNVTNDDYLIETGAAVVAAKDDIIYIAGKAYTFSEELVVFEYDGDDFIARDIDDLESTADADSTVTSYDIYGQLDEGMITSLIYIANE